LPIRYKSSILFLTPVAADIAVTEVVPCLPWRGDLPPSKQPQLACCDRSGFVFAKCGRHRPGSHTVKTSSLVKCPVVVGVDKAVAWALVRSCTVQLLAVAAGRRQVRRASQFLCAGGYHRDAAGGRTVCAAASAKAWDAVPPEEDWCARVINLGRRADRLERLEWTFSAANEKLLAQLGRIDAVDGQLIDLEDDDLLHFISEDALSLSREAKHRGAFTIVHSDGQLVRFHDHLTQGGIACAMSHCAALAAVAAHPTARWGLILEDDITAVVPNVHEVLPRILSRLPPDWDAVFLGYHGGTLAGTGAGGKDTASQESTAMLELTLDHAEDRVDLGRDLYGPNAGYDPPVLRMFFPLFGLYAWMVTKEAARAALEGAFPVHGQVDYALSKWLVEQRGRSFRVAPRHMLFFSPKSEHGLDSDIQTMAHLQELMEDPSMCERYMSFVNEHSRKLS